MNTRRESFILFTKAELSQFKHEEEEEDKDEEGRKSFI